MNHELSSEEYVHQLEAKYGERRRAKFKAESSTVLAYFQAVSKRLSPTYTIEKVLAVGGTGIVHLGWHERLPQPIVLKINRPNVDPESVSMVEHEAQVLPALNHPNIIRVLDIGELSELTPKLSYIVEPFITGSKPFFTFDKEHVNETWLHAKIEEVKDAMPKASDLPYEDEAGQATGLVACLLCDMAKLFSQWVDLLSHLHSKHANAEAGYAYLDVKPDNVLIDEHLHMTSIDYGSVERLDSQDPSPIEVFYTERYAHPKLIRSKKEKASSNRVRGAIKRSDLTRMFDYFALGMSMLEVLHEVALTRPHRVPQFPLYRSLHFLATRLLDGQNSSRAADGYSLASQVFPSLHDSDYERLAYDNLKDAFRDLEKERGRWSLENEVPELATYSKDIVRVVPGYNTVLTPRLRGVIEHPLVARLKYVTQLGLVSLVYPTADHSRYDHALGSYTYTTYYMKSLFNDLGNPIFRNLVGNEDLNAVLLAALLHDLGQYPLAHDLEEVHERIFKHAHVGETLLEDATPDQRGRTLLQIIEDPQNGWGVRADTLRQIIGAHSKNLPLGETETPLKIDVLSAIVDGPVDADKADYIIRDSVRCELPYGSQLDIERLLRVLTVAIIPEEASPLRRVTLGVYDKGVASAHAFGQARYQLFSTVYWHHAARIVKAMLQYATALGLPLDVFGPYTPDRARTEVKIRERLLEFVKSLVPPFKLPDKHPTHLDATPPKGLDLAAEPPDRVFAAVATDTTRGPDEADLPEKTNWYPGVAWTDWLMLKWIGDLPRSSAQGRNLLDGIRNRRLYKRIAALTRDGPHADLIQKLEALGWTERVDLCKKLCDHVHERLRRDWVNLDTRTSMSESDFERLCKRHLLILIDIPSPSKKIGHERPLGVVPELKEKSYQQNTRQAAEDVSWRDIIGQMFEGIAPVRILCHPDVRNLVSAVYAPVESSMAKLLGSFF